MQVKVTQSGPTLWDPMDCSLPGSSVLGILQARMLKWVAHSLLQRIFLTQRSNPNLPHSTRIFYQLSHQGSPRILERVAYPFSIGSSQPRNQTGVSCTAGGFFTSWATREALHWTVTHWKTQRRNILLKAQLTHKTWRDSKKSLSKPLSLAQFVTQQ